MNQKFIFAILLVMLLAPLDMESKAAIKREQSDVGINSAEREQARSKVKKKVKKGQEVPQLLNYPSAELSEYRLHGGNFVIKGRFILPDPQLINQLEGRMLANMSDYIVNKRELSVVEFNDDGSFLLNLYVPYPMFLRLSTINVYACPGDTIETTVDISDSASPKQNISGTGLSLEVNQLIEKIDKAYCELPLMEDADKQTPDSLLKWCDEQVARLDDVVRLMNAGLPELEGCSPLASDILRTYIVSAHLKRICNTYFRMDKNGLDERAYWQQYFSFLAPREKYLLDNPLLMISCSDLFFTSVQDAIMDPVIRQGWQGKILPLDYNAAYARELAENDDVTRCESQKRAMDMLHDKLNISPTNFSAQVCMLRDLFSRIDLNKDMPDRNAEYVTSTLPIITHPELMRYALLTYRKYIKENELKQVEQRPITKGDSIFQRIIEPYKGNVLYVDFWEMSCGPCRGKMVEMREEVEANKDKPVKYLYITHDTPEKCRSFLGPNSIKGEQIFVTPAEWNYLKEKFDFVALPFVMLFDKQGKRRNTVTVEQLLQE